MTTHSKNGRRPQRCCADGRTIGSSDGEGVCRNASADDTKKLTGCLVKGQGDGGYLLVNAQMEPSSTPAPQQAAEPGTVGTAGVFANVFYWLKNDDNLKPHVGHRIEVEGEVEGDVKAGEIGDRPEG